MDGIIKYERSIIVACDVDTLERLRNLVRATADIKGIGGYKIGFELVMRFGMKRTIETIRSLSSLPIIYDHQKAGTDIPFTSEKFASACSGVDAAILFPQAGPETEKAWINALMKKGIAVIVGGEMTHEGYLESEGGFICDEAPDRIYRIAAELGVRDFVVPGNKPERIRHYHELIKRLVEPVFYSPGLISQGGDITESGKAAGRRWHAIIGRAIYNSNDIHGSAELIAKRLLGGGDD